MLFIVCIGAWLALQDKGEVKNLLQQARAADGQVSRATAEKILALDPSGTSLRQSLDLAQAGWLSQQALEGDAGARVLLRRAWVLEPDEARRIVDSLADGEPQALERYGSLLVPQLVADLGDGERRTRALQALDRLGPRAEPALIAALATDELALLKPVAEWLATRGGLRAAAALRARQEALAPDSPLRPALDAAWGALARRMPEYATASAGELYRALAAGLDRGAVPTLAADDAEWTWDTERGLLRFPRYEKGELTVEVDVPRTHAIIQDAVAALELAPPEPVAHAAEPPPPVAGPTANEVVVFYATDRKYEPLTLAWCWRGAVGWLYALLAALVLHFGWKHVVRSEFQGVRRHLRRLLIGALVVYAAFVGLDVSLALAKRARLGHGYTDARELAYTTAAPGQQYGALGTCVVSVPEAARREIGELNGPGLLSLEFVEDPRSHFVLLDIHEQPDAAQYFRDLRADAARANSAFVFVHGYNVSFEDAARRTAQLKLDLQFGGAAIFYSWPSKATALDYTRDESSIEWAIPHLHAFLLALRRELPDTRIHLLAHSMGNRALAGALQRFARDANAQAASERLRGFDEVVLAAPDIDAETFRSELFPAMRRGADGFTLYACDKDKALVVSAGVHGWKRVGQEASAFAALEGLESIQVALRASLLDDVLALDHSYYGDVSTVLEDVRKTLNGRGPQSAERQGGGLVAQPDGSWSLDGTMRPASAP